VSGLPARTVERNDRLRADHFRRVAGAGGEIEPITGAEIIGFVADRDPESPLDDAVAFRLRMLMRWKRDSFAISVDGDLLAFGFHEAQHPLFGQGTVVGVPAFQKHPAHERSVVRWRVQVRRTCPRDMLSQSRLTAFRPSFFSFSILTASRSGPPTLRRK
jgi:hypothetical protein